jgi:hypothetical protein
MKSASHAGAHLSSMYKPHSRQSSVSRRTQRERPNYRAVRELDFHVSSLDSCIDVLSIGIYRDCEKKRGDGSIKISLT